MDQAYTHCSHLIDLDKASSNRPLPIEVLASPLLCLLSFAASSVPLAHSPIVMFNRISQGLDNSGFQGNGRASGGGRGGSAAAALRSAGLMDDDTGMRSGAAGPSRRLGASGNGPIRGGSRMRGGRSGVNSSTAGPVSITDPSD